MKRRKRSEEEKQKNTGKKQIKRIVSLFFLLAAVLAALFIYRLYREDKRYVDRFEELEKAEEQDTGYDKKKPENGNPDWIGWLKIRNSSISYPVMQRQGDAEYYLHRDFDGAYSFYGTPFLDIRCTPDSDNCIIYGHNINGGRMFGALHAYAGESYYKKHPEIQFRAGEEKRTYKIVSVIQTNTSSLVYSFVDTGNYEECLVARQNNGVSKRAGERSGVLKETGPRAILTPQKEKARQNGRRMKEPEEPMFTITATDRHGVVYHGRIRRLTPRECFRLQGYHDSQIDRIIDKTSDSQLYKQAGNGVTVNVVEAIGRNIRAVDEERKKADSGKGGDVLSI